MDCDRRPNAQPRRAWRDDRGVEWQDREQPILEAVRRVEDEHKRDVENLDELVSLVGLDRASAAIGVRALLTASPPFLSAVDASVGYGSDDEYLAVALAERGRRATGQWPSEDSAAAFLEMLDAHVQDADTDEERGRWERLRDSAKALGTRAISDLTIAYLRQRAGL